MQEQPNLKELEKSLYAKFQEDGIWDIFLGIFLISDGLLMEFSNTSYIGIFVGVMILFVYGLKKKITEPRIGTVVFSKKRQLKERSTYFSVAVIFVLIFLLMTFFYFKIAPPSESKDLFVSDPSILLALVFSLVLATVAFLYKIMRFVWYAIMIMFLFSMAGLVNINATYMFVLSGLVIAISGIKLLIEFLKKYPKHESSIESNGV